MIRKLVLPKLNLEVIYKDPPFQENVCEKASNGNDKLEKSCKLDSCFKDRGSFNCFKGFMFLLNLAVNLDFIEKKKSTI